MAGIRLLAPDPLDQRTGGYRYDRHMVEALRATGHSARIEGLTGRFPDVDAAAVDALHTALAAEIDGPVVVDGLASAALAYIDLAHLPGPPPLLLVHHPFVDDPDLEPALRDWLARAERTAFDRCGGLIATSPYTARRLVELGADADRIRVVEPGTAPATTTRGSDGPGVCLFALGAVVPRKGHDVLIEALGRLGRREWQCRIAGNRNRMPEWARGLDARAGELGIARHIEWLGEVDEAGLEAAWQDVDALVLASHYEGYGMVVAEALVRGLPVVTTTGGALVETLPEGCGWSVAPGDPDALARALAELIDRPGRRASRARAARQAGAGLPDWNVQARRLSEVVEELGAR